MTDRPSGHLTPDPADPPRPVGPVDPPDEGVEAAWFQASVRPVVDAPPVPDAWPHIRDRASGAAPATIPLPRSTPARPARRAWLLVAAAVATVGGLAGGLSLLAQDEPASVGDGEDDGPTGFYAPSDLPAGWEVSSLREVTDDSWADACPCELAQWRRGDHHLIAFRTHETEFDTRELYVPFVFGEVETSPLVIGVDRATGWQVHDTEQDITAYAANRDGVTTYLVGSGTDVDGAPTELEDELRGLVTGEVVPPDGYTVSRTGSIGDDVREVNEVRGNLRNEALGLEVSFRLVPDPLGTSAIVTSPAARTITLPGSGLKVVDPSEGSQLGLYGSWPGDAGFLISSDLGEGQATEGVTIEHLEALAASFRPASSEEWARFVEEHAGVDQDVRYRNQTLAALVEDRLLDLIVHDDELTAGEELGELGTDGPPPGPDDPDDEPSVGEPAATPPPAPPTAPGQTTLPPPSATVRPSGTDLVVTTDVGPGYVVAGEAFALSVRLENPTDRVVDRFCDGYRWSLIGEDGRPLDRWDGPDGGTCGPAGTLGPAEQVTLPFAVRTERSGRAIDPGRYRAVVEHVDLGVLATTDVVVLPVACGGTDGLVARFAGRPATEVDRQIADEPVHIGERWFDGVRAAPAAPLSDRIPGALAQATFHLVATNGVVDAVCSTP